MSSLAISKRVTLLVVLLELPISVLIPLGWAGILSVGLEAVRGPIVALAVLTLVIDALVLRALLRPADDWREAESEAALLRAHDALRATPIRFNTFFNVTRVVGYVLATAWVWLFMAERAPIGPPELVAVALLLVANACGGSVFGFPVTSMLLDQERAALSRALSARNLHPPRRKHSLSTRLTLFILAFVGAPLMVVSTAAVANATALDRYQAVLELDLAARRDLDRLAAGGAPTEGTIVDAEALPPHNDDTFDKLPPLEHRVSLDRRSRMASVAVPLDGGRWLLVEGPVRTRLHSGNFMLVICFVAIAVWAAISAVIIPRSLLAPLRSLDAPLRRLVRVGDIREIEHTPVLQDDELGTLADCVNHLIDELRELADAAQAVAEGELSVEIGHQGDLHEAFRGMLVHLRKMVGRIRETASDVRETVSEISAAAELRESGAVKHNSQIQEVGERMSSLAETAQTIARTSEAVLDNAEQTLQTTDTMVAKITELNRQAGGITDLLELIREIAERSDLLALNGSLEASHAGEAGRGFGLVAAEMRRLAERVTRAVADLRPRLADIESAGVSTVLATEQSRKLARDTAEAARRISALTQAQSQDTSHVSSTVLELTRFVAVAAASTSQSRAAAEGLALQVEELDRLTRQFDLGVGGERRDREPS